MTNNNTTYIYIGLLVLCIVGVLVFMQMETRTKLANEKLNSEALLSEKLLLQKSLDQRLDSLKSGAILQSKLNDDLTFKTKTIATQTAENLRIKKNLRQATQQLTKEDSLKRVLTERLHVNNDSLTSFVSLNKNLSDSLNLLAMKNKTLSNDLTKAKMRFIDQVLATAVKRKNNKVTSKACLTEKLLVTITLPTQLDKMNYTVESPQGTILNEKGSIASRIVSSEEMYTASAINVFVPTFKTSKVEIEYKPNEKLKPGVYTFKIYNDQVYISSIQVMLR